MADSAQTYAIEVEGLTKSFGSNLALRGLDFKVNHGESVVILGPNGAGKTTLIKVLATIMNPSSGKVLIGGLNAKTDAEQIRSLIGVVTHQIFFYSNLAAYEDLEFYSRLYNVRKLKERISEVVNLVGMTSRLHDRDGTLSRGMQQRLSIARALLHGPTVLLLDEPETGLDQQALPLLWKVLKGEGGVRRTTVMATHNLERALDTGDRFVILRQGKISYEVPREGLSLASLKEAYRSATGAEHDILA